MPQKMTAQDTIHTIKNGGAGIGASGAGIGVSLMEHVNTALQTASLLLGVIIGAITLYNLTLGKRKKK